MHIPANKMTAIKRKNDKNQHFILFIKKSSQGGAY